MKRLPKPFEEYTFEEWRDRCYEGLPSPLRETMRKEYPFTRKMWDELKAEQVVHPMPSKIEGVKLGYQDKLHRISKLPDGRQLRTYARVVSIVENKTNMTNREIYEKLGLTASL